jgi:hypothetical protein
MKGEKEMLEKGIQVINMLRSVAEALADKERRMVALERSIFHANQKLDRWKADTLRAINDEEDSKGKKVFSNDTMRKGEVSKRMEGSEEAREVAALLDEKSKVEFEAKQNERELRVCFAEATLYTAAVNRPEAPSLSPMVI